MDLELANRLRVLRKKNKHSQAFVAEKLSITQAAYSLIENAQNCINTDHVKKLSDLYQVSTDFIIKGKKNCITVSPSNGFVPFVKSTAHGGFVDNPSERLFHEESEWYKIPGFQPSENHCLFEVEGNSMVPTVFSGDILICQKSENWERILDNSIVVLVSLNNLEVKRIHRTATNGFRFECDNPAENEEVTLAKNEITDLFMVRGKISNVLVPNHQVTSMGKVQNLEKRIEFMEKELFRSLKKLHLK